MSELTYVYIKIIRKCIEYVIGVFRKGKTVPGLELQNISMYLMIFDFPELPQKLPSYFVNDFSLLFFQPPWLEHATTNLSLVLLFDFLMDPFFPRFQISGFFFTFFSSHIVAEESDSFPKYSNVQIWPYREATISWGNRELKRLSKSSENITSLVVHDGTRDGR